MGRFKWLGKETKKSSIVYKVKRFGYEYEITFKIVGNEIFSTDMFKQIKITELLNATDTCTMKFTQGSETISTMSGKITLSNNIKTNLDDRIVSICSGLGTEGVTTVVTLVGKLNNVKYLKDDVWKEINFNGTYSV